MNPDQIAEYVLPNIERRLDEEGFEAATHAIRTWVNRGTVSGPNLVAELTYWLGYWGGRTGD